MPVEAQSIPFDFITDEGLRGGLGSDYKEMVQCAEVGAWKAVHLLAGSIIEAVLVDYLVGTAKQKKPDPMSMGMADLVSAGKKAGVLSKKSTDLAGALREYRNLIHPGRSKRLNEVPDREGAIVAQSLVRLIVGEISEKQTKERGFTAEQLSRKFATDPSAIKVSGHLLKQVDEHELKRLLVEIVPNGYFSELEEEYPRKDFLRSQSGLYRSAFSYAPDGVKRSAMRTYAKILREAHGTLVEIYERKFFLAEHLAWVDGDDEALVKEHLIAQLDDPDPGLIAAAEGIGAFLSEQEARVFVDRLVRVSVTKRNNPIGLAAKQLLLDEYSNTPRSLDPVIAQRLAEWVEAYEARGEQGESSAEIVREIHAFYDTPF
jgi:hypothetical protein